MQIIGIDCASKPEKTGIAMGEYQNNTISIHAVCMGNKKQSIADLLFPLIKVDEEVLLAIDAPLGWSAPMGRLLANHQAGEPIEEEQDRFFRRITDTFIHQQTGKLPLEVGADRIARTAHSALKIIGELREKGLSFQMLWQSNFLEKSKNRFGVIEVYPSATLKQYQFVSSGYKGNSIDEKNKRIEIIKHVAVYLPTIPQFSDLQDNADMLDAVICLLCAKDFIEGEAMSPTDLALAKKEGWIWVRK
jgi:predicted nuclease with RNAse H fold